MYGILAYFENNMKMALSMIFKDGRFVSYLQKYIAYKKVFTYICCFQNEHGKRDRLEFKHH